MGVIENRRKYNGKAFYSVYAINPDVFYDVYQKCWVEIEDERPSIGLLQERVFPTKKKAIKELFRCVEILKLGSFVLTKFNATSIRDNFSIELKIHLGSNWNKSNSKRKKYVSIKTKFKRDFGQLRLIHKKIKLKR